VNATYTPAERRAIYLRNCRFLVVACVLSGAYYLWWLLVDARAANPWLFGILIAAELFNLIQAAGFWYTISNQKWTVPPDADFSASGERVDAFITVYGEPYDVVENTVAAVAAIRHPRLSVWVLDDGPDPEISRIAERHGAAYLTRPDRSGAKAGNVNHALSLSAGDFVIIFDADHAPVPEFLERTMACFAEESVAFAQTPQSYRNRFENRVAAGAHEQQALFYGPILRGKDSANAVFSCGTNVVFRRTALEQIGGIPEDSITEDLRVSLVLKRLRWTSVYVSEVLATGLGPVDVRGYFSQQKRWARGGLEILMRRRPFFLGMGGPRGVQYALSFLYWFTGLAYLGYIILPLAFLFFDQRPVQVPNEYPSHFLPYVFITLLTMVYASEFTLTFRGIWFTLAAFPVHIAALFESVFGGAARFVVTSKTAGARSLRPVIPQLLTLLALGVAIPYGLVTGGVTPSVVNNVAFALGHILIVSGFVRLALRPEAIDSGSSAEHDAADVSASPADTAPGGRR
jgi:cellulose synthase (UDP-forming)